MQVRITMNVQNSRPELKQYDLSETLSPGQSAEARIKQYLADHAQHLAGKQPPESGLEVEITDKAGEVWKWMGWGHEKLIQSKNFLRAKPVSMASSGFYPSPMDGD